MERSTQQRLLGAAILLAILVIVVPEWLDGAGYRNRYPADIDIPEAPEFKPLPASDPLPIEAPQLDAQPVQETLDASTDVIPVADTASMDTGTRNAEPDAAAPAETAPPVVVNPPKPATESKTETKAKPAAKPAMKNAWALQIGSFSDKKNALKMRDQFRAKKYSAYVDEEKGSFRVRIGPELDRTRLERMQTRITKEEGIKGMIVSK